MGTARRFAVRSTMMLVLTSGTAFAQATPPSGGDKAAAETLYEEGRQLVKTGKLEEACPKFAESERLDPAVGTLLYIAMCYERAGKLASAWGTFREARGMAHRAGQDEREKLAIARADALEPKLPRLLVRLAPGQTAADVEVRHDDVVVGSALLGSATPVDPGAHTIVARAAGYGEWRKTVQLEPALTVTVDIPVLEKTEPPEAPVPSGSSPTPAMTTSPPPSVPHQGTSGRRVAALGLGGLGVIGIGIGSVMGLRAFSSWSDAENGCPDDRCTRPGRDAADSASSSATISTIAFAAAVACLAGGAVLWFTGSEKTVGRNGSALSGRF